MLVPIVGVAVGELIDGIGTGRAAVLGLPIVPVDVGTVLVGVTAGADLEVEVDGGLLGHVPAVVGRPFVTCFTDEAVMRRCGHVGDPLRVARLALFIESLCRPADQQGGKGDDQNTEVALLHPHPPGFREFRTHSVCVKETLVTTRLLVSLLSQDEERSLPPLPLGSAECSSMNPLKKFK
jgi:hypothetical protein